MKRLWIGVVLLAALLLAGILMTGAFRLYFRSLSQNLDLAAAAAMKEDWVKAEEGTAQAKKAWERKRNLIAAVADHEPVEEMDNLFAQLEFAGAQQETYEFTALCCQVASLAKAFVDSQSIQWWNLL